MATTDSVTSATTTTTTASTYSYTSSSSSSNSSSNIDWSGLIEAAVAQKTTAATTIDLKVENNEAKIAAYEEMQSLMQGIMDAAGTIRGTANSLTAKDDAFSLREAYLTGYGNVSAASAIVVTADADADLTSYDIEIDQLATSQKVAGSSYEGKTDDLGLSGSISLGLEGGDAVNVNLNASMSLSEVAEAINLKKGSSGVSASVLEVSQGNFRLILSATETGKQIEMGDPSGDGLGEALGLVDSEGAWTEELQEAKNAIIRIDGIEVTRSSNTLDDVIDGVSFSIYQKTEDNATINVEIANDLTTIKSAITGLVEAYNSYREWALTQSETATSGGASADSVLFADSTLRAANSAVADGLSTIIGSESMALLGLSYDESNFLELDETTLNEALLEDLDEVEKLLSFTSTSTSDDVALLARNDNMPEALSLDIEVDENGTLISASVDGNSDLFTINGARIKGKEGSPYEGMTFVFTGTESQTVDMTFSSGIMEKLFNSMQGYTDTDDGILTNLVSGLTETNEALEEEASSIRTRAKDYRATLTARYAAYQAQIQAAQSSLDYLEALLKTGND
ncbi:flagellar filament capping protein FliD [Roseibium limicola]|uniref:Flagellar hook-associated protein 2 n=1 Tax=Roseibium limicola TaxID=2816037 RepID=A0A939EQM9_9HYPH|nr:flagellar filament capping protein FliD [Roseibium limicola]MBO0346560.1 flagellar filament capping protein FliD [Roseibium limicola]